MTPHDAVKKTSDLSTSLTMPAARLHGAGDLRIESVPHPGAPGRGEALVRVRACGVCGSDLHTYLDGRIGDTALKSPLILGHEFAGTVEAVGSDCLDGNFQPLVPGTCVAVDPAQPCGRCDLCEQGHPNLCRNLPFCGLWPHDGALRPYIRMPARCCFPVPAEMDPAVAATLEALGVAIHAVDLAKIRVGDSVAILGAGPIGLCILQLVRLAGAGSIFISDKFPWRLEMARRFAGVVASTDEESVEAVNRATGNRGVDVAIEAAWADHSVQQAAEMLRPGGRMVVVGIPADDRLQMKHSTARRKGLTIRMARRMKHTYPRAIELVRSGKVDLGSLISHRFPLERAAEAFAINASYAPGAVKVMIEI